jgi:hypothetical protein
MISEITSEGSIPTFCTEVVTLFESYIAFMFKEKKEDELSSSLTHLFGCLRPSKHYIKMVCHILESIPTPILKKAISKTDISKPFLTNSSLCDQVLSREIQD